MISALVVDINAGQPVEALVLGRTLAAYPLLACRAARGLSTVHLVSDAPAVKAVGLQYDARIIDPPAGADADPARSRFLHGARRALSELDADKAPIEFLVLLFTHAATVTGDLIEQGLDLLHSRPEAEAALSASEAKTFSPYLARRLAPEGWLEPLLPAPEGRLPDVLFPDMGAAILRASALRSLLSAPPAGPAPWLSLKSLALRQWGPGPMEHSWQLPALESWLKKHGYADITPSRELQPKPQPSPKAGR